MTTYMEEGLQSSAKFDDSIDNDDDSKYLCGLSTILVANIQELKDRISQIEFIFCSQLFPNFQLRSKSLQKKLLDVKKATNDDWNKKESSLFNQIKELQLEKQRTQEEGQRLTVSLEETRTRLLNTEAKLIKYEQEKLELLSKAENLEKYEQIIANLKEQLGQKSEELAEGKKLQEKLFQQIDLKDHNLMVEQSKRKGLFEEFSKFKDSYKHLKSQYNFLLSKIGDDKDSKRHQDMTSEVNDLPGPMLNKRIPQGSEHKTKEISHLTSMLEERKTDDSNLQKKIQRNQDNSYVNQSSTSLPPKRSEPLIGMKRSATSWRDTRMREEQGGADPHDDFLDTPSEMMTRNLNMAPHEEVHDLPVDFNDSDDETQEVVKPKQNISVNVTASANKGFKFVEPVRKKNERENLRGVECKQCKKFYDAVLPDENDGHTGMRCEHQDGVSRHRYRYAPPMTPEGFWNIGFESEM